MTNELAVDYNIVGTTLTFSVAPASGEVVTALIDTSHNATFAKFIAGATGTGQAFTLPSTAVKVLHVSVDHLTTTNHTTSGASITINDNVTTGDLVTIVYLDNTTCVSTGGNTENQHLLLSGNTLSITEADGTTILNSVTLPGGGGTVFNIDVPASTPTIINHNLNILYPHVTVYLDIPGEYIVCFPDVVMQDADNIIIEHSITTYPTIPLAVRISN